MDSSITALFNAYWARDDEKFKRLYPMSLRPQAHEIIRNWTFYTILRSLLLTGMKPWDDIMIHGFIMAPDGTPMHTSRGNIIDPLPLLDQHGADALRYYSTTCALGLDHAFQVKEVVHGRKLCTKLWNIANFIGRTLEKKYTNEDLSLLKLQLVDRWILSRYSEVVRGATEYLDNYEFDKAMRVIENFTWHEVADFYLEMVKHRIVDKADEAVRATLYVLGLNIIKLFAPFLCHLSEEIYQRYYSRFEPEKSIHLSAWPAPVFMDKEAERNGELLTKIIAGIRAYKSQHNIPQGRIIESVELSSPEIDMLAGSEELIARTVRAKKCVLSRHVALEWRITALNPIYSKLGTKFKHHAKEVLEFIKDCNPEEVGPVILKGGYEVRLSFGTVRLTTEYLEVKKQETMRDSTQLNVVRVEDITIIVCV
jgi:valyl-tRNA synthetase